MTFDLEGQGQGQNPKRLLKSAPVSRKAYFSWQFSSEGPNILGYGSPIVGAYGVSTEFCSDALCPGIATVPKQFYFGKR